MLGFQPCGRRGLTAMIAAGEIRALAGLKRLLASVFFLSGSAVILGSSLAPQTAMACASCGSGGDDPLVLYPNQGWRFYLAATRSFGFKTIKRNGDVGSENAPAQKDAYTLAVGKAMTPAAFVTLTVPYLVNTKGNERRESLGDPLVAARWTILTQDISTPWIPQVQVLFSHRFAQARAQQEAEHPARLDVFGQGVSETKMGVDVFQGMMDLKFGGAYAFVFPDERNLGGQEYFPGLGQRGLVTVGYGRTGIGKALLGFTREVRGNKRIDGLEIENSDVIENGYFLTADGEINETLALRLTWSQKLAILDSANGSQNSAVTCALLWGLPP